MDLEEFRRSLDGDGPPPGSSPALAGLWHQGQGDWDRAHALAQEGGGADGAWVHAHVHRVEGDLPNADYWYRRAGRSRPGGSLEEEWEAIAGALLADL